MIRNYEELIKMKTFKERYNYLRIYGTVGIATFGFDRHLNQRLYKSYRWKKVRDFVIVRDNACDLGIPDLSIYKKILIHHMNPISIDDILNENENLYDPNNLICTSTKTHNAIHFGDDSLLRESIVERSRNDTCPWL